MSASERVRHALACVVLGAALAACSGGQPSATSATYATQLAAAQSEYRQALGEVRERGRSAVVADDAAVLPVYEQMLEATRAAHEHYARLDPPAGLAVEHERLVALLAEQVDVLEGVLSAAVARDASRVDEAIQRLAGVLADWAEAHHVLSETAKSTA